MMAIDYASTSIEESETATIGTGVQLHSVATKASCNWHNTLVVAKLNERQQ
jgi:hypothetical protein